MRNFFEDLVQIHAIIILSPALNNLICELKIVEDLLLKLGFKKSLNFLNVISDSQMYQLRKIIPKNEFYA